MTMTQGKQTCKIMKEIPWQIAEATGVEFATLECRCKGNSLGICPKCKAEMRYREQQLRPRSIAGKVGTLACILAAFLAMLMPISTEAQILTDINILPSDSISATSVNSGKIKGLVRYEFETEVDSIASEELIGATILNLTNGNRTATDIFGKFEMYAQEGDTIQVSFVAYKPKTIIVTDIKQPINVTLDTMIAPFSEISIFGSDSYYLDLHVKDEHGNLMDRSKLDIRRIWINEDGEEYYEYLAPLCLDEKHLCRIYWSYDQALKDENGKPLKEITLRIAAEDYDDPAIIKVKCSKLNTSKTIKFKHKKK